MGESVRGEIECAVYCALSVVIFIEYVIGRLIEMLDFQVGEGVW